MTAPEGHINGRAIKKGREQEYIAKGKDGTVATSNELSLPLKCICKAGCLPRMISVCRQGLLKNFLFSEPFSWATL